PLGMESPAYWIVDSAGTEMAFAGLNMTARDLARLGELHRNGGLWQGRHIIPPQWVCDSVTVAAPHLEASRPQVGGHTTDLGYGYQWWLPGRPRRLHRDRRLWPVRLRRPGQPHHHRETVRQPQVRESASESDNRVIEAVAFLRAIAGHTHRQ
ncbi:hypothetical protein ABZ499_35475, partial [Streptomyces sp. NPDC019990]